MAGPDEIHGSCLCGGVAFTALPPLRDVVICHCSQCRRTSGHLWAATSVPLDRFRMTSDRALAWYRASPRARRGFCGDCGASLFWQPDDEERIAIAAGALDPPTGLRVMAEIHLADAADYCRPGPTMPAPATLDCRCLCGANAFRLPGPTGPITACHCRQCRKLSGHYAASFDAEEARIEWRAGPDLREYATPGGGRRGFCGHCGSSLWFRSAAGEFSVEAGTVAGATGGRLAEHIFTSARGDYYDIDDGLPQSGGGGG